MLNLKLLPKTAVTAFFGEPDLPEKQYILFQLLRYLTVQTALAVWLSTIVVVCLLMTLVWQPLYDYVNLVLGELSLVGRKQFMSI